ncbi:hypothetical protein [Novosphingobium panipatense]|uniref:Major facilitator superfamily (MFS) profile domain-containing protein n=1 Tax=Novosphingobium panipatense TaxID=428991 RepID=A0ABY1Q3S5_9SPHN|nr:hypothetical protein [Novosphingobium panipatense]SMP58455.1 hypothetical protein SAMN06296065_102475 [Novosphingobium panipatense]
MTKRQRLLHSILSGILVGLVLAVGATSGLSYAIDRPITGCAFISIGLFGVLLGALTGAVAQDLSK